jgi:GcrA cell cycle regulator
MGDTADRIPWSDDRILLLRSLWREGYSTTEIGCPLNVSKNAIVGKAHRLDLDSRAPPIKRGDYARSLPKVMSKPVPKLAEIMPRAACTAMLTRQEIANQPSPAGAGSSGEKQTAPASAPERRQPLRVGTPVCCWPLGELVP